MRCVPNTGYKWLDRLLRWGVQGLAEQSRWPHNLPEQLNSEVVCKMVRPNSFTRIEDRARFGHYISVSTDRLPRLADAAHEDGIIVLGLQAGHHDGLVETQSGGFVNRPGVTAGAPEVLFGPGDEERAALMQPMPAGKSR